MTHGSPCVKTSKKALQVAFSFVIYSLWIWAGLDAFFSGSGGVSGGAIIGGVFDAISLEQQQRTEGLSFLDIVDPALMHPPDAAIRGGWRTDAAVVLDRELTSLASMDAHCRVLQARLSRRFLQQRAWRPLGFVRLPDYTRERLGIAPRTLEDDARVMTLLDALPALRAALEHGEIGWTTVRTLVRVATRENDASLLEYAGTMTTRKLEAFVRELETTGTPSADQADSSAGAVETGNAENTDPEVRLRIVVSRTGRRLFRVAHELASRSAGAPLNAAQSLELVLAEAMAAAPAHDAAGGRWLPPLDGMAQRFLANHQNRETRGEAAIRGFLAEAGVCEGFDWLACPRRGAGPAAQLDALGRDVDALDAVELDRRLRVIQRAAQRIDSQMAALLRIGIDRRLFREIGFATVRLYVASRLGFCPSKAWSLIAIERACWRVNSVFREAWRDGRISHLAAVVLMPVLNDRHVRAWIERARSVTLRRLKDEVAAALAAADENNDLPAPPVAGARIPVDDSPSADLEEVQMRADGAVRLTDLHPHGAVHLTFRVPVSVAVLAETAFVVHRRHPEARWRTFERILAMAIREWTSVPRHRDPIFERDGWRCTVPACSSRRNLHDHHVTFRSHGGGNAQDNRTTVCAAHHLHGIHAGIVKASGPAPDGIVWELGCRPGGLTLMRLVGDVYATCR